MPEAWVKEKKQKFQELLLKLSNELEEDDIHRWKLLLQAKENLPKAKIQGANGAIEIFTQLQKSELISHDNTDELKQWLTKISRSDLVRHVTEYDICENLPMQSLSLSETDPVPVNVKMSMVVQNFKETETSKELEEKIEKDKVVVLSGMLGSGKSQMALSSGCKFRQNNQNSVVWRLNGKSLDLLLSSISDLGEKLNVKIKGTEQTESGSAIKQLAEEISKKLKTTCHHLFIIDDVNRECESSVKTIIPILVRGTENKCIVTTQNSILNCGPGKVHAKGFSDTEAVEFFTEGKTVSDEKKGHYLELSKFFNNSPLGLHGAKTYMESSNISPKKMLQLLKQYWKKVSDELLPNTHEEKSLFDALSSCIEIMKSEEDSAVFEMFQMLQFMDTENIPVYIFEFLQLVSNGAETALHINALIQAMKKFSFGTVEGEDEKRFISTHQAITMTLREKTSKTDQRQLLVNLLKCFAWLLDKDNIGSDDFERCKSLLTHAKVTVDIAEDLFDEPSIQECFLLIYVSDLVGYTYNFCGLLRDASIYSNKSNELCFRLIKKTEPNVKTEAKQMSGQSETYTLEQFSRCMADVISRELQLILTVQNKRTEISEFAFEYLLKKYRVQRDKKMLKKVFPKRDSECVQISVKEYEELLKEGYAVSREVIPELFLYEMIIQVFYTYGRRLFYVVLASPELVKNFSEHLHTARFLSLKIKEKYPNFPLLYSLLSERNGTLELPLENLTVFESSNQKQEALRQTVRSFEELLNDDSRYYVFGILKMSSVDDDHHKKQCMKQLVRCHKDLYSLESHEEEKINLKENGTKHANALLELLDREQKSDHGFKCRIADFFYTVGNLDKAEKMFENIYPFGHGSDTSRQSSLEHRFSKHELNACFGLINCSRLKRNFQYAKDLADTLQNKLETQSPDADSDAYKKKLEEMQNELELEMRRMSDTIA